MFAWNVVYISKVVQLQFIQALRRFSTQKSNEARSFACSLRVCHAHNICMFGIFTKWLYGWLSISLCHSWVSVEKESVWKPLWIRNVPMQCNAMRCARFPICATRLSFSYSKVIVHYSESKPKKKHQSCVPVLRIFEKTHSQFNRLQFFFVWSFFNYFFFKYSRKKFRSTNCERT